jgi:ubiquinone/menaquinone biosynthesis C-methylase UbiE
MSGENLDRWASWLLQTRSGGDPEVAERLARHLRGIRDKVIANAMVRAGDVALDVGAGDGLIGFAALAHVGESGSVILTAISSDVIDHMRSAAKPLDAAGRLRFAAAAAEDLAAVEDAPV